MRLLAAILFLFLAVTSQAQFRGYQWVMPDSAGIDFTILPSAPFNSSLSGNYFAGSGGYLINASCISSEQGELLFYTNGYHVFDANHDTMPNGFGLAGSTSAYNGSIILPYPEHEDSLYVIIHSWMFNAIHPPGIYYTVINMNKRGGLGDVDSLQKNMVAYTQDTLTAPICAIQHGNGRDWWVLHKQGGHTDIVKLLLTPDGLAFTGKQSVGMELWTWFSSGEFVANSQGTQLALAMTDPYGPLDPDNTSKIEVFDVDRCSGELSLLHTFSPTLCYAVSYSPNGKLLYYHTYDTLYQVKGLDGSQPVVQTPVGFNPYFDNSSQTTLSQSYSWSNHELGPDGRIYISMVRHIFPDTTYALQNMSLCTIDSPDIEGLGCSFQMNSFYLGGKRASWGLPNMPNYNLGALVGSGCDTLTSVVISHQPFLNLDFALHPNPGFDQFTCTYNLPLSHQGVIEVRDFLGRLLLSVAAQTNSTRVSTKALADGIYHVRLARGGETLGSAKWVKLQ